MSKIGLSETSLGLNQIKPIDNIIPKTPEAPDAKDAGQLSFGEFLMDKVKESNDLSLKADSMIQQTIAGGNVSPHNTLVALQKADISFRLMMSVKERIVQAYQEIMRTPIG